MKGMRKMSEEITKELRELHEYAEASGYQVLYDEKEDYLDLTHSPFNLNIHVHEDDGMFYVKTIDYNKTLPEEKLTFEEMKALLKKVISE
jgi:hypothetical protein